jgi:hypothetical protein
MWYNISGPEGPLPHPTDKKRRLDFSSLCDVFPVADIAAAPTIPNLGDAFTCGNQFVEFCNELFFAFDFEDIVVGATAAGSVDCAGMLVGVDVDSVDIRVVSKHSFYFLSFLRLFPLSDHIIA